MMPNQAFGPTARGVLLSVALGCAAVSPAPASSAAPAQPQRTPNIVFVLVDDMRWDEVRAAGHPFIETPHMDRLAREGARFLNAFATTPLCSPSRASFLTGQYARAHGIVDNTARPSHQLATFPRALEQAGYRTGFFGKWHMGNDDSPRPGFTRWVAMPGQGEAIDPQLNVDGQRIRVSGYATDVLTDYVARFIQEAGARPFLVYLAHKAIHPNVVQRDDGKVVPLAGQPGGFVAAERHRGRYAALADAETRQAPSSRPSTNRRYSERLTICRRSAVKPPRKTMTFAAGSRCCWRSMTASGGYWPRSKSSGRSTTPSSCSRAIMATSMANTD